MEDAVCNQEFASAPLAGQEVPVGKLSASLLVEMEECAILLVSAPALAAGKAAGAKELFVAHRA